MPYYSGMAEYDSTRSTYAQTRVADPRIAVAIEHALGDASCVVNVVDIGSIRSRHIDLKLTHVLQLARQCEFFYFTI